MLRQTGYKQKADLAILWLDTHDPYSLFVDGELG